MVRQMAKMCDNDNATTEAEKALYDYCHGDKPKRLEFPNYFITISPSEWNFPMPAILENWTKATPTRISEMAGPIALHIYNVLHAAMKQVLTSGPFFEHVFHSCIRTEFQGRGTVHIHVAVWAIPRPGLKLAGRTGTNHDSALVRMFEELFNSRVDVQDGNGFLNYINGYTTKANEALHFKMTEHFKNADAHAIWRQTYRLMCKHAPLLPEVFISMAGLPHMHRSFCTDVIYAVKPGLVKEGASDGNETQKLYRVYCKPMVARTATVTESFADYARQWVWSEPKKQARRRRHTDQKPITAIGIRFSFEMLDNYIGEFATTFFPHSDIKTFTMTQSPQLMEYTQFYRSTMEYLCRLRWESQDIINMGQQRYKRTAFPKGLPDFTAAGRPVFEDNTIRSAITEAADYLEFVIRLDLMRRVGPSRRKTFAQRIKAIRLLHNHATTSENPAAMAELWNRKRATQLQPRQWSPQQQAIINTVEGLLLLADEDLVINSQRQLFIEGEPGTGKSEVMVHLALCLAPWGLCVCVGQ